MIPAKLKWIRISFPICEAKKILFAIVILVFTFISGAFAEPIEADSSINFPPLALSGDTEILLFTLQGSNTLGARLAPMWAKAYLEAKGVQGVFVESLKTPNTYRVQGRFGSAKVYVDIHAHGSSTGFRGLLAKTADIAMSSRPIKPEEAAQLIARGNLRSAESEHVVAIDGLAVIVNKSNYLHETTVDQVAQIFTGKIKNWKLLGGPDRLIRLYARDDNSGTFDTFQTLVLGNQYSLSAHAERFESNDELSDRVATDSAGIGFVGLASLGDTKPLAISDKNSSSLKPEILFVATEDYPLSRRLYLYTPTDSDNPYVQEFVGFAQGYLGQSLVEQVGFISQNPRPLDSELSNGPENYLALARISKRLSVNIRFQPNKAVIDNKALQDIKRLANYVRSINSTNLEVAHSRSSKRIQLVGFSNLESSERRAEVLSRLRATAVKSELYRLGVTTESVLGFGDSLPIANELGATSSKNDRVEVWIFDEEQLSAVNDIKHTISLSSRSVSDAKTLSNVP
jgi:phosphate transport system substrate-binding protein